MTYFHIDPLFMKSPAPIKKWRRTGLLKSLNDFEQRVIAHYFEALMYKLVHAPGAAMPVDDRKRWAGLLFPLQRRVFPRQLDLNSDGNAIVAGEEVDISFERFERFKGDFDCAYGVDFEGVFIKMVAEEVVSRTPCVPIWGMKVER